MSGAFKQIFQGMLLLIIDIKLDWFDVALDAIGYAMIAVALTRLIPESAAFRTARLFAVVTGVVSLPAMIPFGPLQPFATTLQLVLDIFMIWYLCSGIVEVAHAHANAGLAERAVTVRTLNLAASTIIVLGTAAAAFTGKHLNLNFPGSFTGANLIFIFLPLVLLGLIAAVLTLMLLRRAEVAFAEPVRTVHSA